MDLSSQVCSIELSKILKDIGVRQESLFYWLKVKSNDENIKLYGIVYVTNMFDEKIVFEEIYSAFTTGELGKMIHWQKLYMFKPPLKHFNDKDNEADFRSKILIELIEKKLISVESINAII